GGLVLARPAVPRHHVVLQPQQMEGWRGPEGHAGVLDLAAAPRRVLLPRAARDRGCGLRPLEPGRVPGVGRRHLGRAGLAVADLRTLLAGRCHLEAAQDGSLQAAGDGLTYL